MGQEKFRSYCFQTWHGTSLTESLKCRSFSSTTSHTITPDTGTGYSAIVPFTLLKRISYIMDISGTKEHSKITLVYHRLCRK